MRTTTWRASTVLVASLALAGCYTGVQDDGGDDDAGGTADDGGDGATGDGADDGPVPDPNDDPPAPGQEFECESPIQDPGPTLARRLNRAELLATVGDVLGIDATDLHDALPLDYRAEGYTNTAAALVLTTDDVELLANFADAVVGRIADLATFVGGHTSCTDYTVACEEEYIRSVATRIYRRPPTDMEVAALVTVFDHHQTEGDPFTDGASAALEVMLQSPPFLYRLESQSSADATGGYRDLDGYELANRLSYLVWGSAPDNALMQAAEAGTLSSADERISQVQRMLSVARTQETSLRFLGDWTHIERVEFNGETLAADMIEETEAFFEEVVWQDGAPLSSLFNAQFTHASGALAEAYGLTSKGAGLERYNLTNVPERGGILTQAVMLTMEDGTASMVQRGKYVLEKVICGAVESPPPGVDDSPPDPEPGKSKRFYAEQRIATAPCGGCHVQMDTIGFAFEHYDGSGVWQDTDEHGNELGSNGTLSTQFHDDIAFENSAELADLLASDARVSDCMLLSVYQFTIGRRLAVADGCTLAAIRDAVADGGATYQGVLEAFVAQQSFAQIRIDE